VGSAGEEKPGKLTSWFCKIFSTWFGVGFLKPGPGTWASASAILLWWFSFYHHPNQSWMNFGLHALIITMAGVPLSGVTARESGQRDPNFIVIDEVAGQWIALIAVPLRWQYALASFILFRGFDIFKPPPLRLLEKLPGGWGIMLDDVGAGLYALALVQLWIYLAPLR
jgi:phosphatidylglycerophosphatase A